MSWNALRNLLVVALAFFAFYVPSSFNGVISREMTIVSLVGTCALLAALVAAPRGLGSPLLVLNSLGMMALPLLFTITSGLGDYSPGVIFIYLQLALLYVANLRTLAPSAVVPIGFFVINLVSIVMGFSLALDVKVVDEFVKANYSAFYGDLVSTMVDYFSKPVLTFGTHSTAGFMYYLFFYLCFTTYRTAGSRVNLVFALCYIALMFAVTSTTGTFFVGAALFQMVWHLGRRYQWAATPLALAATATPLILILVFEGAASDAAASFRSALVGDKYRGLFSRYATEGLLAGNFAYLAEHPLSPIGFSFSESLFLGDSGYIVNMVRGSLPLAIMVYGGLLLFLRSNLLSRTAALWIWLVIMAFEIAFTPLQYFRFIGFVPLAIVYLNALPQGASVKLSRQAGSTVAAPLIP